MAENNHHHFHVLLPTAVEDLINRICHDQNQLPPDSIIRQGLAAVGEQQALQILRAIHGQPIRKSLSAFIAYMLNNYRTITPSTPSTPSTPRTPSPTRPGQPSSERELGKSYEASIKQLRKDLSESKREVRRVEANMAETLSAKNAEIESLLSSMDAVKRQAALSEGNLASMQRVADERTAKATKLEQKVALLEVKCASLNQELQDMEARVRREQKKSPEEANQVIQMQAWQEELERAPPGQREAENRLSSLETEMQKMRVQMAAMKMVSSCKKQ